MDIDTEWAILSIQRLSKSVNVTMAEEEKEKQQKMRIDANGMATLFPLELEMLFALFSYAFAAAYCANNGLATSRDAAELMQTMAPFLRSTIFGKTM